MITTWSALRALEKLDMLNLIDSNAALDFVMSCYRDNGGFSVAPDVDADPGVVPLGLFCLQILGRTDLIRTENTTEYLLQFWDNSTGHVPDTTLVVSERMIWSLGILGTLDRIDIDEALTWVLNSQSIKNGAFLTTPYEDADTEKLEWTRAATHILELTDSLDMLDDNITVLEYPEYTTPQWYIDYIDEHFGTTTDNPPFTVILPDIAVIMGILVSVAPIAIIGSLVAIPGVYLFWSDRKKKAERRERRKKKKL